MTVQEFQARKIERMAQTVAHFVATTSADRLTWCPAVGDESCTRSVLGQVAECIAVNRRFAALLSGVEPPAEQPAAEDGAAAQEALIASGQALAAAVRTLPDDALAKTYATPRGDLPGEVVIDLPYRNMAYHGGQINFIQLLLGDKEFHLPPQAFK